MAVNSTTDPTSISKVPTAPASEVASCIDFSCLSAAWEAIKSFFSMLVSALRDCFCCCCEEGQGVPLEESTAIVPTKIEKGPVNPGKQELKGPQLSLMSQFKELRKQSPYAEIPIAPLTEPAFSKFYGKLDFAFKLDLENESQNAMRKEINKFQNALTAKIGEVLSNEGFLTSVQMTALQKAIKEEIRLFNEAMKKEKGSRAILIQEVEFRPLAQLENLICICGELEKLANNSSIAIQNVKTIEVIAKELEVESTPKSVHDYLGYLVRIIRSKPFENKTQFEKHFAILEKKLNLSSYPLFDANDLIQKANEYLAKLDKDLFQLIQDNVNIEPAELEEIVGVARNEYKQFLEVMWKHLGYTKKVEINSTAILQDLVELISIWKDMCELSSDKLSLDKKMELLTNTAKRLPENHAIYFKYPLKDAMEKSLITLGLKFFSDEVFHVLNPEHELKKGQIASAIDLLARKLGCKAPQLPKLVMDDSKDPKHATDAESREITNALPVIQKAYYTSLEFGEAVAIEMAAQSIISFVVTVKDRKEKRDFAKKISSSLNLDPKIINKISSLLDKLIK